jgi:hypothetical protein
MAERPSDFSLGANPRVNLQSPEGERPNTMNTFTDYRQNAQLLGDDLGQGNWLGLGDDINSLSTSTGSRLQGSSSSLQSLQSLPTRKRQRDIYSPTMTSDLLFPDPKSRRATPTQLPATSNSSPSSRPPSRLSEGNRVLGELLGLSDNDTFSDIQREQLEAERQLEERREQERRDAEIARFLEDEWQQSRVPSPAPSIPTLASQSRPILPPPPGRDIEPSFTPSGFSQYAAGPGYRYSSFPSRRLPSPKLPESSSSSQLGYVDISSDSDIEEIRPSDFPAKYRTQIPDHGTTPNHQGVFINGTFFPSNMAPRRAEDRVLGPAGPRSLYPSPSKPWSDMGSSSYSMPGAFPHGVFDPKNLEDPRLGFGRSMYEFPLPSCQRNVDILTFSYRDPPSYYHDPSKTDDELKQLLENIRPDGDLENREGTPEAMKYPLMEHQKLGLAWMKSMEEGSNKGGVLADDMGLGKTIQALALMVSRPSDDPERKTTLIVAPVALTQQWKREIERMLRPEKHQLSVFILHGERKAGTNHFNHLKKHDVVLTTFGTIASEFKRKIDWGNKPQDHPSSPPLPLLGQHSKFYRVIIDEAQCIKNKGTKAAQACSSLESTYRWCMSGTPMMNSVNELYSLIHFLRIPPYNDVTRFSTVS